METNQRIDKAHAEQVSLLVISIIPPDEPHSSRHPQRMGGV